MANQILHLSNLAVEHVFRARGQLVQQSTRSDLERNASGCTNFPEGVQNSQGITDIVIFEHTN